MENQNCDIVIANEPLILLWFNTLILVVCFLSIKMFISNNSVIYPYIDFV